MSATRCLTCNATVIDPFKHRCRYKTGIPAILVVPDRDVGWHYVLDGKASDRVFATAIEAFRTALVICSPLLTPVLQ